MQFIEVCECCTKSSAVACICRNLGGVFLDTVYKNNRDASLELQQNAQMCVSNITEETLHQIAFTRMEEIECLYC